MTTQHARHLTPTQYNEYSLLLSQKRDLREEYKFDAAQATGRGLKQKIERQRIYEARKAEIDREIKKLTDGVK